MDTELLVENRIEEGQRLLAELAAAGFDVSVALWIKAVDERIWLLYVGSKSVEPSRISDAYRSLYSCLSRIPGPTVEMSEVMLVEAGNPIARDAIAARDRQPGRQPVRLRDRSLGSMFVEEAYIYPRVGGQMTPGELVQTLFAMMSRPDGALARPAVVTLRDGTKVATRVTGFVMKPPNNLTIQTLDPASNTEGLLAADDVMNIQP